MYFKMMELSTVCGLVTAQLFIGALAFADLLDLSLQYPLLLYPISYSCHPPPKLTRGGKARPSPLELPCILAIPLALGLEPRYPKLFLSTDINYLDLN